MVSPQHEEAILVGVTLSRFACASGGPHLLLVIQCPAPPHLVNVLGQVLLTSAAMTAGMINGPMVWMMLFMVFIMGTLGITFLICCFMRKRPASSFEGVEPASHSDQVLPHEAAAALNGGEYGNKLSIMVHEQKANSALAAGREAMSTLDKWEEAAAVQVQSPKSPRGDPPPSRSGVVKIDRGAYSSRVAPPTPSCSRPNTASFAMSTLLTEDTASMTVVEWRGTSQGSRRPRNQVSFNQVAPSPASPAAAGGVDGSPQIMRIE